MLIDNIISQADVQKQQEYRIFLCKMNREIVREITSQSYNKSYSPQLGGADSFSFSIAKEYDGKPTLNYDDIVGKNLVLIKQGNTPIGYFEIQNPSTSNDGVSEVKEISALSAEIKLVKKKIFLTSGVFKLQDDFNPEKGLLNIITSLAPSWSIGYIDFELINKQRYFDIVETNVYELAINDIQNSFECVVIFDTMDKTINAYSLPNFGDDSRIILSLNNLLERAVRSEVSEDIVSRLHLYGGNDLTVRDINFGNTFVQNFGYFKNTRFMSQSLITSLNNYETLVNNNRTTYSNYLSTLQTLNSQLITYQSDLLILEGELTSLLEQRAYFQSFGQSTSSLQTQINNKYVQIATKNSQINSTQSSINSVNSNIDSLLDNLNFANNFTQAQIEELDNFIIEDTYQDSAFLITDSMTYNEQIAIQQQLLEAGANILARVSYPRYKIDVDVVDFLKLVDYASWWGELKVGDIIRLDVDDFVIQVRVIGYTHDWDNNNLTISLGDRYQLDDANIDLLELIKSSISAGTSINYNQYKYTDYSDNGKNQILGFINSSLDVAKNAIVSGTGVGVGIDTTGILATAKDSGGNIMPEQLRISNNAIVISNDGFNSAGVAIGIGQDGKMHVIADVIAGKMILGNNMIIETGNGDFRVDGSGVNITKMALNLTSADNLKNILIDASVGIKIRSRTTTSQAFADVFYFDSNAKKFKLRADLEAAGGTFTGNLSAVGGTFTGTLQGADGEFSGTIRAGSIIGSSIVGSNFIGGEIRIGTSSFIKAYNDNGVGVLEFTGAGARIYSSSNQLNFWSTVEDGLINIVSLFGEVIVSGADRVSIVSSNIRFSDRPNVNGDRVVLESDLSGLNQFVTYPNLYAILSNYATQSYAVKDSSSQDIRLQYFSDHLEVSAGGGAWKVIPFV